ncbi:MAG TPA: hypothetical protein VJ647_01945, partial [Chitinophagaceae bacterium]|nr:hypothetical protein [Chitinophagaceae bacterium]
MLLQHPESLAKTAYSGLSAEERRSTVTTAPHLPSGSMVEEYSKELTADVQIIKMAASSYNQDAAAAVSRYQAEYEMHLTVWLNALGKCTETANAGALADASPDILLRNRKAENKFKRFREWRDKAMKGVQRKFLPRTSPVTELGSAKANLKEREDRQRLMKRANSILRSKKDVASRLIELLGPGSEEEVARIQQPGQEGCVGYSPHELNNNNANIFRLKRRVKELEKKIGLMDRSSEEMKETNGIKMIYNYAADRIQLFFTEKPVAGKLRQLKAY